MGTTRALLFGIAAVGIVVFLTVSLAGMGAGQSAPAEAVRVDNDDIGGVVTSPRGPEAGVWVIAETTDLPTKFAKVVVTDDRGRYLVPDLPKANFKMWVRGYGLTDSKPVQSVPGKSLNSDALLAIQNGKWVTLRVPYPMGFYAKGLERRIDDARAGWKGKGLWSTFATRTPFHLETGKGTTSKIVHFQLRPDPLAK